MIYWFKGKKRIIIISIYICIFIITICIIIIHGANCSEWTKGLNNTYIDNDKTKYVAKFNYQINACIKFLE